MPKQLPKELSELQKEQLEIAQRNEAIAELIGFKKYLPSEEIKKVHEKQYPGSMRWYFVPGIGRYNSFELKFDSDWNWLISACVELKKFRNTHLHASILWQAFTEIEVQNIIDLDLKKLWKLVSDYALLIVKIKRTESSAPVKNSDQLYEILYPDKGVAVMDPDGWDRENWQFSWYEELITEEEFNRRLMESTIFRKRNNI
jgi:hypothetical protein